MSAEGPLADLARRLRGHIVILGVGNTLRGDDGVGPYIVEQLEGKTNATLLDAGEVPENHVVKISDMDPAVVLLVDAAHLGAQPGDLAVVESDALAGASFSTHNPSMVPFAAFLEASCGAELIGLGIQPATTAFGAEMTETVRETADRLVAFLASTLPSQEQV